MAKIISFSGIDGSGKTTQVEMLYDYLISKGKKVKVLKASYKPYYKYNFKALTPNFLRTVMALEFHDYYNLNFLEYDYYDYIICDRSKLCLLSYGMSYGATNIDELFEILSDVKDPDYLFFIDIDVDLAISRIMNDKTRNGFSDDESEELLRKASVNYKSVIKKYNFDCFCFKPSENVNDNFKKILKCIGE